jgi:fatty acid amide hydrolase 2
VDRLLELSATELGRRIRKGEVSSFDVVEAHLRRLRAVNPVLHAVVESREKLAREEARAADARIARGDTATLPPLFGVPVTVKENFRLAGFKQTSGLPSRRSYVAENDAPTVARLRAAGGIVLGTTNVSELCMWMESENRVYGRTRNPYDPSRIVGGSSGGEGAIVGSGASPLGVGSDVGGSIRMPAFFNGVFGHKPSPGLIPNTDQYPPAHGPVRRMLGSGPLARRAEDLALAIEILKGPDGRDGICIEQPFLDPRTVDLAKLRVTSVPNDGMHDVEGALVLAQERAAEALGRAGARVETKIFAAFKEAITLWTAVLELGDGPSFREMMEDGVKCSLPVEFARTLVGRGDHTLPALALSALEGLSPYIPGKEKFLRRVEETKAHVHEHLGADGVLLYPSYPRVAPKHRAPLLAPTAWVYTALFNVLECAVTQVPLGLDSRGLPLGVQVVAAPGNDHLSIAVALELEKRFGGWVPPWQSKSWGHTHLNASAAS